MSWAVGALLALGSGAAWATLDAIRKRLGRELSPVAILLGISAAQLPLYGALVLVEASAGGLRVAWGGLAGWALLGVGVLIAANLLLIRALQLSPLSLTTPYLSFTPAVTALFGALVLGQQPGAEGLVGVAIVVAGAFLLNASADDPAGTEATRHPLHVIATEPGSRLAVGVAVLFALGNVVDRKAVLYASEAVYAGVLTLVVTLVLAVPGRPRRELLAHRDKLGWVALGGVVTGTALLLQLFAFRYLFVAYADSVKRAGGNLVAVAFGAYFFAEGDWRKRGLAVAVMSLGVALILHGSTGSR